ncbi:S-layer homology domain-containing protein [Patescibacteria group bacterium]|nr:S-layer homology domain-containing protein [Patescibacteria group bacterium]
MLRKLLPLNIVAVLVMSLFVTPTTDSMDFYSNVKKSTVLIASYDYKGDLLGRGSGFFVDEGIVITNIHVIGGTARYYRVFTTNDDDTIESGCNRLLSISDIKLNIEDDVAYMRAYVDCPHGSVFFSDSDPEIGDEIEIFGYPAIGEDSLGTLDLTSISGHVLDKTQALQQYADIAAQWLVTDAIITAGSSGGPVVQDGKVVGIAVAAHIDKTGKSLDGIFIPVSVIRKGLESSGTASFGYTPQDMQNNTIYKQEEERIRREQATPLNPIPSDGKNVSRADCLMSLGEGAEATSYTKQQGDACRCKSSYHINSTGTECLPGSLQYIEELAAKQIRQEQREIERQKQREKQQEQEQEQEQQQQQQQEPEHLFNDIDISHPYRNAIEWGKESNVLDGYPDGSFKAEQAVNRAEFLKIVLTAKEDFDINLEVEPTGFPDIDEDAWYGPYVRYAKANGIIKGYPDGTFRPDQTVNFAEALKMAYEALGVSTLEVPDKWYSRYLNHARRQGILFDSDSSMESDMTRKDVVWIVWKLTNLK